ncbi:MAG: HU family DNA-binding protein [Patescibacteria group bacterium]
MNKAELINTIADRVGVTKKQAEDMVEAFVEIVTTELVNDREVTIAGFGQFMAKTRAGRTGVNPQNPTEKIQIPPVRVPKFKAGKGLKDALKAPKSSAPSMPEPAAPASEPEAPTYPSM